jgi:hypothetical protein
MLSDSETSLEFEEKIKDRFLASAQNDELQQGFA